ncbi:MAG: isoleucine--tRNA ligase, partial [Alphaproteobacteria bacterium]
TALAEAEVEYHDHESDTIWAKFPMRTANAEVLEALSGASVVIWTTTPWTIPGNRAISYSSKISYGLYEVTDAPEENWAKTGDKLILADALADDVMGSARATTWNRVSDVTPDMLADAACGHPLADMGYDFDIPLLDGAHVMDDAGTGFVHTAPGHGRDDYDIWVASSQNLTARGIDTRIPYTVDADGIYTD